MSVYKKIIVKPVKRAVKKTIATITLLSLELLVVLVAFFGAFSLFIFVARMVLKKRNGFDIWADNFITRYINDGNTNIMQFFSLMGDHRFLIPANLVLIFYFLFIKKHRWYSIKVPAVAISGVLLMFVLKFIFQRERPLTPLLEPARGLSFPSGHSLMSFTFYGLLIYLVWRNVESKLWSSILVTLLLIMILFIGISRVYLEVHYATDVIAGFSMGLMWLVLSIYILDKMEKYSRRKVNPVVQAQ
jgi:membrane-associated phospholipid phosphatase